LNVNVSEQPSGSPPPLEGLDEKQAELALVSPPRERQLFGLGRDLDEPDRSVRPEPPATPVLQREPPSVGFEL
jgi:hypothetical protein